MLLAKNLSYTRSNGRDNNLFRNINFNLSSGQLVLIQGHNGAGKTTLLKILAGLILPEKGRIVWNGQDISKNSEYRSNMSYLAHKDGLRNALTLHENLICDLQLNAKTILPPQMKAVLESFDINSYANSFCQELSAGQRRKGRLAGIILKQNKLWILDEPFTFLDKKSSETLRNYFRLHLSQGGMILMASHQTHEDCHHIIDLSIKVSLC